MSPLECSHWGKPAILGEVWLFWALMLAPWGDCLEKDAWPAPNHFSWPSDPRPRFRHLNKEASGYLQAQLYSITSAPETPSKNSQLRSSNTRTTPHNIGIEFRSGLWQSKRSLDLAQVKMQKEGPRLLPSLPSYSFFNLISSANYLAIFDAVWRI